MPFFRKKSTQIITTPVHIVVDYIFLILIDGEFKEITHTKDSEKITYKDQTASYAKVLNRLKVMAGLDPVYDPQQNDGIINMQTPKQHVCFRLTVGPSDTWFKLCQVNNGDATTPVGQVT